MILTASNTLYVAVQFVPHMKRKQVTIISCSADDRIIGIFIGGVLKYKKDAYKIWSCYNIMSYRIDLIASYNNLKPDIMITFNIGSDACHSIDNNILSVNHGTFFRPMYINYPLYVKLNIQTAHRLARFIKICKHCYTSDMQLITFGGKCITGRRSVKN